MNNIERRFFVVNELRVDGSDGKTPVIVGHAAVFNQLSGDLGGFREQVAPGAFAEAIKSDDVRALFNHDPNFVLGRNKSGTLRLSEDAQGLAIEIDPPDTQWARDLMVTMRRGDVTQMSFGFNVTREGQKWDKAEDGSLPIRTLMKLRLFDVSPVTYPAYTQTDVALRSFQEYKENCEHDVVKNATWRINLMRRELDLLKD